MKSSTAVFMLLEFSCQCLSARVCSYVERGRCVCGLGVCVTPTPPTPGVGPLQILFLLHPSTFWLFHPLAPIVVTYSSLGLLKLRDITRTLTASPEKEVKSFEILFSKHTACSPQLTHTTGGSYGADGVLYKRMSQAKTPDSVYNQIPLNGKFFNSKVWIG